jgi:hypothetical protein
MTLDLLPRGSYSTDSGAFPPPPTPTAHPCMPDFLHDHTSSDRTNSSEPSSPTGTDDRISDDHHNTTHGTMVAAMISDDTPRGSQCHERPDGKLKARRLWNGGGLPPQWKPALTLENSGSVARDHLASERTFLAYVRTSLTIASTGVGEHHPCHLP